MKASIFALCAALATAGCAARRPVSVAAAPVFDSPAPAAAPAPRRGAATIAILPLNNNTGDADFRGLGGTLAEIMSVELAGRSDLRLVERARIEEVVKELRVGQAEIVDQEAAVRVGRLLGASLMAFGSFSKLGEGYILTARVVRVETGEIINAVVERGSQPGELDAMARAAIRDALAAPAGARAPTGAVPSRRDALADSLPTTRRVRPDAFGVVISVRDYKNKDVPRAEFARVDARLMKLYLTRSLGYREENVLELEDPTKAELETVFGGPGDPHGRLSRLLSLRTRGSAEVFVYYSGHGAPSVKTGRSYLVPSDANPDYVELNGYPRDVLLTNLSKLGARRATVVLESCFSGGSGGGALIHDASPLVLRAAKADVPQGVSLITAAGGGQIASWYPEKGHSLFTYFLVRELARRSTAPSSWPALELHVAAEVSVLAAKKYGRDQVPQFSGSGEGLLAR